MPENLGTLSLRVELDTKNYREKIGALRQVAVRDGARIERSLAQGIRGSGQATDGFKRLRGEQVKLSNAFKRTSGDAALVRKALGDVAVATVKANTASSRFRTQFLATFAANAAIGGLNLLAAGINKLRRGLISLKDSSIDTFNELKAGRIALDAVSSSAQQAGERFDFARSTSERLGFSTGPLISEYAKLNSALQDAGFSQGETNKVFESFTGNARLFGQSAADIRGALLGVTQTAGRATIQGDELNQIVDRIPGGLSLLRNGLGLTTEKFSEMRSRGALPARESILVLAEAMSERNARGLPAAMRTAQASADRYRASLNNLSGNIGSVLAPIQGAFQDLGAQIFSNLNENTDVFDRLVGQAEAFSDRLRDNPELVQKLTGLVDRLVTSSLQGAVNLATDLTEWLNQESNLRNLKDGLDDAKNVLNAMVNLVGDIASGLEKAAEFAGNIALGARRTAAVATFKGNEFDARTYARAHGVSEDDIDALFERAYQEIPSGGRSRGRRSTSQNPKADRDALISDLVNEAVRQLDQDLSGSTLSGPRQLVGVSGNTGVGSGAHLHAQILGGGQALTQGQLDRFTDESGVPLSERYGISGRYGDSRERFRGPGAIHQGTDIPTPEGTPIYAVGVKSVSPLVSRGGAGFASVVEFNDGVKIEMFHQIPGAQENLGAAVIGGAVTGGAGTPSSGGGGHAGHDHGTAGGGISAGANFQADAAAREAERAAAEAQREAEREAAAEARRITNVRRSLGSGSEDVARIYEDLVGESLELTHLFEDLVSDLDTSDSRGFNQSIARLRRDAEGFLIEQRDQLNELRDQEAEIMEQLHDVEDALETEAINTERAAELTAQHNQALERVQQNIEAMSSASATVVGLYERQAENLRYEEQERQNAIAAEATARLRADNRAVGRQQEDLVGARGQAEIGARRQRGLGTRDLERNQALRNERLDLSQGLEELDRFAEAVDLDPQQLAAMRDELVAISELRLDTLTREFDVWNGEVLPGIVSQTQSLFSSLISDPQKAGQAIGNFFSGVSKQLADVASQLAVSGLLSLFGVGAGGGAGGLVNIFSQGVSALGGSKLQKFQSGGAVGGAIDSPQLAVVHGGELVLNRQQQKMLLSGGASRGGGQNINISVPVNVGNNGGGMTEADGRRLSRSIEASVRAVLVREQGFRGLLSGQN